MKESQIIESITEGKTNIFVFKRKKSKKGPGSKDNLPFYNPSMELNRDLSILVCQWLVNKRKKHLNILDGLAASGIRGIRFANEIEGNFQITINDWNPKSYDLIKKNIKKLKLKNVVAINRSLNALLSENKFDYIDIDPFGSPVYFIDSAMRSICNDGIIACTATDTATLCGTYPKVCLRRYAAIPYHSIAMKEIGIRILLGYICREAGKYEKGIKPLASYCTDHYFRAYIQIINGTNRANDSMKNYSIVNSNRFFDSENEILDIGPLWTGKIQNKKVIAEIRTNLFKKQLNTKNELWKLLDLLEEEADAPIFFYTTDKLASHIKKSPPKLDKILNNLKKKGYVVYRTHFCQTGFKTDAPKSEIEKVFKQNAI
jgi:tRNA (guanine26-N2/guanine27-N2)-dimethyltransferase